MRWPWQKKDAAETRASASGFTAEVMSARESYISGRRGIGELTGTVQSCITLWEGAFAAANVEGTDHLTPFEMALAARSLALRGEALFLIDGTLIPCADWDLKTRNGRPSAYRISISEAGGGTTQTALADEVLHVRIGADPVAPYYGQSPLKRATITAELLHALEVALRDVFESAPLGTQIVPMPEAPDTDKVQLSRTFKAQRGRLFLPESVSVMAAGGPSPSTDWNPRDLSPNLERSMTAETLAAARESICNVFGILPSLFSSSATGPLVREAQRHLATWTLAPIAKLLSQEASDKLGGDVSIDVHGPLQAYDAGGRARALTGIIQGMAAAKEAGLSSEEFASAAKFAGVE
ncbi:MAG: phage portal protein [Pseudomonadota bacterium]